MSSRRHFLTTAARVGAGLSLAPFFAGLQGCSKNVAARRSANLISDVDGVCDLPEGFSYRVISPFGARMSDGLTVPSFHDGMGCFGLADGKVALVRNHEVPVSVGSNPVSPMPDFAYDANSSGGTTTVWLNDQLDIERHYLSLTGTIRNCSGGVTPWGTWISCEEPGPDGWMMGERHGYAFEVDPKNPLQKNMPLTAMGRFNREAVAVDAATGIVYQTEDSGMGCFYRFMPKTPGVLADGGRLQALAFVDSQMTHTTKQPLMLGKRYPCKWVDIADPDPEEYNVPLQAIDKGAAVFVRGEGIVAHRDGIYFSCTDGGRFGIGQIFRYVPGANNIGAIELVHEASDESVLGHPDNITFSPWGDLIICEDGDLDEQCLVGLTQTGRVYHIASTTKSEWSGACFSPDGQTLFANIQKNPGMTVAISGPWSSIVSVRS